MMALTCKLRFIATLYLVINVLPRACRGSDSNIPPAVQFPGHNFPVPFDPAISDLGGHPIKDILLDEVRFVHPQIPSGHVGSDAFDSSMSRTRDPEGFGQKYPDVTDSSPYQPIRNGYNSLDAKMNVSYSTNDSTKKTTNGKRQKATSALGSIHDTVLQYLDHRGSEVGRQFSSMSFPSLEAALLSLAFLTFAVFLIDLVQDLLKGTSTGRRSRADEGADNGMTDVIVLALSSVDTLSFGSQNPDCGQKLLCHLNRSGWHDGFFGTASNYFVSLILTVFSPDSGFQKNLDAAEFGKENEDCTDRYSACPSVLGNLLPT